MFSNSARVSVHPASVWPPTGLTAVAAAIALSGCSAGLDDEADGPPHFAGSIPAVSGSPTPAPGTPGIPPPGSGATAGSPTASAGEQNPAGGAPIAPGANTNTGNANTNTGSAGGGNMVGAEDDGNVGAGGSAVGNAGSTGEEPVTPPPQGGEPPPVTPPPAPAPTGPDIPCPNSATFCSGFESTALPAAARLQSNPVVQLQFDTAVRRSGNQSIVFPATSDGFNIREVVVPIPGQAFWARLFMQTSTEFGDNDHDSVFVGSTATLDQDNNQEHGPEFSEQGNQVLLNADDDLFSAAGPGFPSVPGPTLSAGTWHCMEAFFDGASGDVEIFADGALLIDAPGFKQLTYQTFRFGYLQFPGGASRTVWFDDVVVAPDRVGCN